MLSYIARRVLLIIPTLLGIMAINFAIIQAAPGGPIDRVLAQLQGVAQGATSQFSGISDDVAQTSNATNFSTTDHQTANRYKGIDPQIIAELRTQFGFDKPVLDRFIDMLVQYAQFDFDNSYFQDRTVISLLIEKMPVSISLGLWSSLIIYFVSIPLGIAKAVRDGSRFDIWTSTIVIIGNAIPGFLFAILLIVLFAGGRYLDWFPLRGLVSPDWDALSWPNRIIDYFWHLALPIFAMVIGGFATLTVLSKNSFLDELGKQYVMTARAKGNDAHGVLYGHVFRNAMLIVISGFPGILMGLLFSGALLIEIIFSLDGLGLLGYESVINRDYPVIFATLYIFTLLGLVLSIISDITYMLIDPRINFEGKE